MTSSSTITIPKSRYYLKGFFQTLFVLIVMVWSWENLIEERYVVGEAPDPKLAPICVNERLFLVDKLRTPARDEFVMYSSKQIDPYVKAGTLVTKLVKGVPGDHIKVVNGEVYINGKFIDSLQSVIMDKLKTNPSDYDRELTLGPTEYWVMGYLPRSFDSRYWGPISKFQIVGKAWALW